MPTTREVQLIKVRDGWLARVWSDKSRTRADLLTAPTEKEARQKVNDLLVRLHREETDNDPTVYTVSASSQSEGGLIQVTWST